MPNGGMLLINNPVYQPIVGPQVPLSNASLPMDYRVKQLFSLGQRRTGLPLRAYGQNFIRLVRKLRTGNAIAPMDPRDEFAIPMDAEPHEVMLAVVNSVGESGEIVRRRGLYAAFSRALQPLGVSPVFAALPSGVSPYGYPFYADTAADIDTVTKLARKRGLDCIHWPDLPGGLDSPLLPHYEKLWLINFLC